MSRIFVLAQVEEDEMEVTFTVVHDTYDFGMWVNRWFAVQPIVTELNENCYHVIVVHPTFISLSQVSITIENDLLKYIGGLSYEQQKLAMIDGSILGRML